MGYAKVVKVSDREVRFVHQLDGDGKPYAEDVTLTIPEGVDPSRLAYYAEQDGKVGVISYSFSPANPAPASVAFPEGD
jgi:hypothetical protein